MSPFRLRRLALSLIALAFATGIASEARALTIDCATAGCIGGIYTLDVAETAPNSFVATYTIDTTTAFDVRATHLVDINFKVATDYTDVTLLSGPSASLGGGPLSGGGCRGNNDSFICGDLTSSLERGRVYTWRIQFGATALIDEWHVGARYVSPIHRRGWVISESGRSNPIPEPSAALIFGVGMLVASGLVAGSGHID